MKSGECKKPVSTNKKDHGGCSEWQNKELYDAWYAEFGKDIEELTKAIREVYGV